MEKHPFKVVIVGGSIAGLTLAHCLSHAQIDYAILEKRADVAPQEGASIGIMPNGARILQQLGLYSVLEELIHPLEEAHITYPDGFTFSSQYPRLLRERFGFPLAFLDRQKVLELLGAKLPHQDKLHLGTKVVGIEQMKTRIRVHTDSGLFHDGDLVVGADGVHSVTREEMWRLSGVSSQHEKKQMPVHYACVFGISSPLPNLLAGKQITCYNDAWSILSVVGKNGRIYWFLFYKLGRKYHYMSAPRFSAEEAMERCAALGREPFWQDITFGDLWAARETFNVTTLEEYVLRQWNWENIVCIGDSVHKIAPHTGQGANCAMEDAAALATALQQLLCGRRDSSPPSSEEIGQMLEAFSCGRRARMLNVAYASRVAMRLQALDGLFLRLLARYYIPFTGDMPADRASRGIADAPFVGFLPVPQPSGAGWGMFGEGARARWSFVPSIVSLAVVGVLWFVLLPYTR